MKKIIKYILALLLFAIPCLTTLSACSSNVETELVRCDLNGGNFTNEYKQENNVSSDNILKMINLNYYGGFSDGLPCEKDMIAPTGKVFAGWYIDKNCSPSSYLTSSNWESFSEGIKNKTGNNVIYARWIDANTKDILYEVVNNEVSFNENFITKNTENGNMTNSTIVRFNVSAENFNTQKNNLPQEDDLTYNSTDYEFNGWKVENNGHYYDFKNKKYDTNATNNMNSYVNADFDSINFVDFFAEGNENIAYVLLRPKTLSLKPWNKITIALDINVAGYNFDVYNTQIETAKNEIGYFGYSLDPKGCWTDMDENGNYNATYYANLSLEIRYDMDYESVYKIIPVVSMLDDSLQFDGWTFTIGENKYDFNKQNWKTYAEICPEGDYREIKFELKTADAK